MLTSFALLFLLSLILGHTAKVIKLPPLIGILLSGIILGPYVLNLIAPEILNISPDLRQVALVVILMRAGLSLNLEELKRAGKSTLFMAFMPATFEIIGVILLAPYLLGLTLIESALLGSVVAAVSPAVVVPKMLHIMEEKYGTNKSIPQMIVAAGSVDDVFVIVLFTLFLGFLQGNADISSTIINLPTSIITGLILGCITGYLANVFFKRFHIRDTSKVIILLSIAFLLLAFEEIISEYIATSGLLAIMAMGGALYYFYPILAKRLSVKFQKLWVAAEILLFVLVGASIDLSYVQNAGLSAVLLILGCWLFRMAGVGVALLGNKLTWKERLFCMIAYSPKATVQAAIGSIPLAMGLPCGNIILTVAVISIIITAPLGAFGIDLTYKKLLTKD